MKRIEAIIPPSRGGKVCTALERMGYPGSRISQIEDRSRKNTGYLLRGATYKADFAARSKIEVIVHDGETGMIVNAIRKAVFSGGTGDCEIFVHAMEVACS